MQPAKPNYIKSLLFQNCPHCRRGKMFRHDKYRLQNFMQMNNACGVCGQKMELEPGFYYGTGYVSYVLTVAFSVTTFAAWWVLIGVSLDDNRMFWWLGVNTVLLLLLQPFFMRLSRAIWLSFFIKYDPCAGRHDPSRE